MVTKATCPPRDELLSAITGDRLEPELASHLAECSECSRHVEQMRFMVSGLRTTLTAREMAGTTSAAPAATASVEARPASIGKYLIVGQLGRGGQASVYRGVHSSLGRDVAIKWSHHALDADADAHHRLMKEGSLLASLDHPGILRVFDVDVHEGRPFLVLEFARGCDLVHFAQREKPTPRQAASIVARVARALAYSHQHGVVHQDIKPQNILVDEAGRPRLADFGIARLGNIWSGDSSETSEGGTLNYMAPEQLQPDGVSGPASDIFGLGGVLFFLLCGQEPRRLPENVTLAFEEVRKGSIDWSRLEQSNAPRALQPICRKALALPAENRYARAEDMAVDLERFVERSSVVRRGLSWLAAAVLAGILVLGVALLQSRNGPLQGVNDEEQKAPSRMSVRVVRGNTSTLVRTPSDLEKLLPLRQGDELAIGGRAPAKMHLTLFAATLTDGPKLSVREIAPLRRTSDNYSTSNLLPLEGSPATELLFACGSTSGQPTAQEVGAMLMDVPELRAWIEKGSRLPQNVTLTFDLATVDRSALLNRVGDPKYDALAGMADALDDLRTKLRARYEYAEGLVFTHVPVDGAPEGRKRGGDAPPGKEADNMPTDQEQALFDGVMKKLLATDLVRKNYPREFVWPPRYYLLPNSASEFNAYAGPDGFDFDKNKNKVRAVMTLGYIRKIVQGSDEVLAAIMGHELAHLLKKHIALTREERKELLMVAFSRDQEIEADLMGVQIAVQANFDYRSGVRSAFREQKALGDYSNFEGLKATHPSWNDRLHFLDRKEPHIWKAMSAFENGQVFLWLEQYGTAEQCFRKVVEQFPDCSEAWANLGYAMLMQYCDALDVTDLRKFGIGQFAVGAFYERPTGIADIRGKQKELWKAAVKALETALAKDKDAHLPRVNLGLAYLVHFEGEALTDKALSYFEEAAKIEDKRVAALNRASFLTNYGVALKAAGRTDEAGEKFEQASKIVATAKGPAVVRDYLEDALLYNVGFLAAAGPARMQKEAGLKLLDRYLKVASPDSPWWKLAYDRYAKLARETGAFASPEDQLAKRSPEGRFRVLSSLDIGKNSTLTLSEPTIDALKRLGKEDAIGLQAFPRSKIKKYLEVAPGVDILASDKILTIFLVSDKAPPLVLQGKGIGADKKEIRVGMPIRELIQILQNPQVESRIIDDPKTSYLFLPNLGLGIRVRDNIVSELVVAQIPRK